MITNLKPYSAYKDAGVEWLGQVPEHWSVRRLKYLLRERDARSETGTEQLLSVSQYVGVTERKRSDNLEEPDTRAESLVGYKRVDPGELVVNIMLAWNGSMGVSRYAGIVSPAYCVYRFEALAEPWYFHHLLRSPVYKARIKAVSTGVVESRLRLYTDDLYRLMALLPPLPEQTAIVRFLDWAERRIRRVIRARQRRIKLLEEYKQALIHQAVTGRIDVRTGQPYPAYKDSGVEWLGQVPEHWEVVPLKRLAWFKSGAGFPVHHQGDASAEIPFFKVSDMNIPGNEKYLRVCANTVSMTVAQGLGATVFPAGTIVFPKVGGALLTNKRRIAANQCCIDNNMMACVARNGNRDFLFLVMSYIDLGQIAQPGPVPAISEGEVREIRVALPSAAEQTAIVEYLDAQTAKIDAAIAADRRAIELLEEFRTRLIADVVTGKLDVREVAARLPEEPSEEDAPWTDEEERAQDETLNGEGDHAAISEEDG
ncbi:restriction endonuclease subunit S [Desulfofundulus salinus]|uniref:Restriction endonuclease subunit S n=1 Tax=Desulfofundulus salinus TaxID=2419843 RepID=A0A494X497_9FIRM|nr:restriction endonuclease subunit S [Desulfofundulus salinum]RKO67995.1 restriction endonuclease subunit S [Desulfofundulus salinum]